MILSSFYDSTYRFMLLTSVSIHVSQYKVHNFSSFFFLKVFTYVYVSTLVGVSFHLERLRFKGWTKYFIYVYRHDLNHWSGNKQAFPGQEIGMCVCVYKCFNIWRKWTMLGVGLCRTITCLWMSISLQCLLK